MSRVGKQGMGAVVDALTLVEAPASSRFRAGLSRGVFRSVIASPAACMLATQETGPICFKFILISSDL